MEISRQDVEAKLIEVFYSEKYLRLFPICDRNQWSELCPAATQHGSHTNTLIKAQTQAILDLIKEKGDKNES